jgi:heme oxygenase
MSTYATDRVFWMGKVTRTRVRVLAQCISRARNFSKLRLPASETSLRQCLRTATDVVHQRLHGHSGFAAVQDGTIGQTDYVRLLVRLDGFHRAFEDAACISDERSGWLARDLETMRGECWLPGVRQQRPAMPQLDSAERVLGALYVVEGSALGGRSLARGLDRLLGSGESNGRRFFEGRGPSTGAAWRDFVGRLDLIPAKSAARVSAVDAAVEVFSVFETWLAGWRTADVG